MANKPEKNEKIVSGGATIKKKSTTKKLVDDFLAEDIPSILDTVRKDLFIPGIKRFTLSVIETAFYGGSAPRNNQSSNTPYYSYGSGYSNNTRSNYDRPIDARTYENIVIFNRGDAERVLDQMRRDIRQYHRVTGACMCEYVGVDFAYTDYLYGWTDLTRAYVERVHDGYRIHLDKPVLLD